MVSFSQFFVGATKEIFDLPSPLDFLKIEDLARGAP